MVRRQSPKAVAPPFRGPRGKPSTGVMQAAAADALLAPHSRVARPPATTWAAAEELVPAPGGAFQVRSGQRQTLSPPTGTFNFVRVHGEAPRSRPVLVSAKLAHAQIAAGRPVVYAGTARFERGEMAWWSNYSGTYQPIAAFRAQAGLPEDKFVPWQRLQMGGTSMQRGTFIERRASETASPTPRADTGKTKEAAKPGPQPAVSTAAKSAPQAAAKPAPQTASRPDAAARGAPAKANGKPAASATGDGS